ncbi:MAG TPA: Hsp33 family molecular chaperone HslO [Anaeromyxobacteraceae bacterium]|nr:Hsp33 family molecular chaperone HslO [Anaeromyxobacteraceae bacterium]
MTDRICRGLYPARGVRVVLARVTETARLARMLHGLYPTSAWLFAQGLAGGMLLGALQKREDAHVNLQLECDGPVGGFLVDADAAGNVRGYVRHAEVNFPGDPSRGAHAAMGGAGHLTVLRPTTEGGYYRSTVELEAFDLPADLRRWFASSEQVATALDLCVLPHGDEPLGDVVGLLVQRLPDGDDGAIEAARARIAAGAVREALAGDPHPQAAIEAVLGGGFELMADLEVAWRCGCDHARARAAASALGPGGIDEVLAGERRLVIDCQFCRKQYVLEEAELREIRGKLAAQGG